MGYTKEGYIKQIHEDLRMARFMKDYDIGNSYYWIKLARKHLLELARYDIPLNLRKDLEQEIRKVDIGLDMLGGLTKYNLGKSGSEEI